MDIIHLLEVLKPLNNVVTIKIDNDKELFTSIFDFLIAIAPTIIAALAMWYSYKQFNISLKNQSVQFRLGLKQQANALKINTQLATEIELVKDECKTLRESYVAFMDNSSIVYHSHKERNKYVEIEAEADTETLAAYAREQRDKAYELIKLHTNKLIQERMLMLSYLDVSDTKEKEFLDCINEITTFAVDAKGEAGKLGALQAQGANLCFELIKKKRQKILDLAKTIPD